MKDAFTLNGKCPLTFIHYFAQRYSGFLTKHKNKNKKKILKNFYKKKKKKEIQNQ